MTYAAVPVDEQGFDQLAQGLTGFSDQAQDELRKSMMTTIFISGASAQSEGRCAYMLGEDGSRIWLPNSLRCWITDLAVVTQTYDSFDPVDKLLVSVTASDGTNWVYRMGLNSWTASSFLTCLKAMTTQQHSEKVQITLTPKGRATFVSVSCVQADLSSFERVTIPKADLGRKLGYDEALDVITYVNRKAQENPESEQVKAQVQPDDVPFDVPEEELTQLIDEIQQPKRRRRKATAPKADAPVTA